MNIKAYLERIGAVESEKRDIEYLAYLQERHLLTIPFENLDISQKKPIVLAPELFFQKIIEGKRGGICFELNGLFNILLNELGFETKLVSASVRNEKGGWIREDGHPTNIVTINKKDYLVEVGYGNAARKPIPLSGEESEDISGVYRAETLGEKYDLQRKQEGEWVTIYRFSSEHKPLEKFKDGSDFIQYSPLSHFTQMRAVTIATEQGRITAINNTVTITKNNTKENFTFNEDELPCILQTYFGIIL
ncbi:arylamine N-acetyltransferase [Lacrimispora sp.]|uniref:arylamine N-acetyltransferase family protein n=1 Tax=Lacrimispora sp. TaxID=2719234 RepID=UPI00345FCD85